MCRGIEAAIWAFWDQLLSIHKSKGGLILGYLSDGAVRQIPGN